MIKAKWMYSVIMALEARLDYANEENLEEKDMVKEALDYFKGLKLEVHD